MDRLDYEYLAGILDKARAGDGNAFAEIYTATYQAQYHMIFLDTRDARLSLDILLKIYITAIQDIDTLQSSKQLLPWLDEIRWKLCEEHCDHYTRSSSGSLKQESSRLSSEGWLDSFTANQVLTHVMSVCGIQANDVPVDVLESWKNYLKPGIYQARYVICIFLVLLTLIPLFFIRPSVRIDWYGRDISGNAEYTIHIGSILPMRSISARLNGVDVPLDKMKFRTYSFTVPENGELMISAESFNGQVRTRSCELMPYDTEPPVLIAEDRRGDKVYLTIRETYSGIDYDKISGLPPLNYDEESGVVVVMAPEVETEVVIPDRAGNKLKISVLP